MRKIVTYFFIFCLGALITFLYLKKDISDREKEQTQIILNEVKNVRKLVVVESTFSQLYNYEKSKYFIIEEFSFDKKVVLAVTATIQISYDLTKLNIETDTINKKVILNKIPQPEVFISPNISYFDFEQSTFNSFTKEELNRVHAKAIKKIKEASDITGLKETAKIQLIEELQKIYKMTTLLDWEFVDHTGLNIMPNKFKD
jgi:electron transfer flavoprotein alpha subunit